MNYATYHTLNGVTNQKYNSMPHADHVRKVSIF